MDKKTKFICSIYSDRPQQCVDYPWNFANQIFVDCQFYDKENEKLFSNEELLLQKTDKEISEFCVTCGKCCFFGHAKCSKLGVA